MELIGASLWNFRHLQILLLNSVTVPEGYMGHETCVCFDLTNRSSQVFVLEFVLQGAWGRESHSHWRRGSL